MASIPMQFSFSTHSATAARQVDEDDPFRILVLADLGGGQALAQRKPVAIDIDNFDKVMARLAVQLQLTLAGETLNLGFQSMDDFHPDALFARLAPFAALRQLRTALADPAQFQRAAAALGMTAASGTQSPDTTPDDAIDMERLLGRKPTTPRPESNGPDHASTPDLNTWLRRVVSPHVVQDISGAQAQLTAAVDATLAATLRSVLHDPKFQALEANWRSIERMVRELDPGQSLQLCLLDVSRGELAQDIHAHRADLSQSALHRLLCGPQTEPPAGQRWSLLVSDLYVDAHLDDLQLLAALGALAARAGAPLLAAARPALVGSAGVETLPEPKTWQALPADVAAFWQALRHSPIARWIGLALPRILARLPYGPHSDPVSSFAFDELLPRTHAHYLWASPAYSLALLAGQAFLDEGWAMELAPRLDVADLPSHIYREDGQAHQQACAEVECSESASQAILRHGLMAVMSLRGRNAARLLRWQSMAEPAQALQGRWA